jgi:hypothetical protein
MYRLWRRFALFFYLTGGCLVSRHPMLSGLSNFYIIMHSSITKLICLVGDLYIPGLSLIPTHLLRVDAVFGWLNILLHQ